MTVRALSARRRPLDTRPLAYALSRMHPSLLVALVDEHADPAARAAAADILDDLLAEASVAGDELAEVA